MESCHASFSEGEFSHTVYERRHTSCIYLPFLKYLIVFPALSGIIDHIEEKRIHGCQLLDYFSNYTSGVEILNQIIAT